MGFWLPLHTLRAGGFEEQGVRVCIQEERIVLYYN